MREKIEQPQVIIATSSRESNEINVTKHERLNDEMDDSDSSVIEIWT